MWEDQCTGGVVLRWVVLPAFLLAPFSFSLVFVVGAERDFGLGMFITGVSLMGLAAMRFLAKILYPWATFFPGLRGPTSWISDAEAGTVFCYHLLYVLVQAGVVTGLNIGAAWWLKRERPGAVSVFVTTLYISPAVSSAFFALTRLQSVPRVPHFLYNPGTRRYLVARAAWRGSSPEFDRMAAPFGPEELGRILLLICVGKRASLTIGQEMEAYSNLLKAGADPNVQLELRRHKELWDKHMGRSSHPHEVDPLVWSVPLAICPVRNAKSNLEGICLECNTIVSHEAGTVTTVIPERSDQLIRLLAQLAWDAGLELDLVPISRWLVLSIEASNGVTREQNLEVLAFLHPYTEDCGVAPLPNGPLGPFSLGGPVALLHFIRL